MTWTLWILLYFLAGITWTLWQSQCIPGKHVIRRMGHRPAFWIGVAIALLVWPLAVFTAAGLAIWSRRHTTRALPQLTPEQIEQISREVQRMIDSGVSVPNCGTCGARLKEFPHKCGPKIETYLKTPTESVFEEEVGIPPTLGGEIGGSVTVLSLP